MIEREKYKDTVTSTIREESSYREDSILRIEILMRGDIGP